MPVHNDAKSQLNARYLEGLASIEKRKIQNEARGAAVGLCLFGVNNRTNRGFVRLGNLARTFVFMHGIHSAKLILCILCHVKQIKGPTE